MRDVLHCIGRLIMRPRTPARLTFYLENMKYQMTAEGTRNSALQGLSGKVTGIPRFYAACRIPSCSRLEAGRPIVLTYSGLGCVIHAAKY